LGDELRQESLPAGKPGFIEPMKPRLLESPPAGKDWVYEIKFDGIRALAIKNGKKVSLMSRNQNELGPRYPDILQSIKDLPLNDCVLDGEVVALDGKGRSSFQLLQALEMEGRKSPVYYYVFDLLEAEGKSLLSLPLERRKELLGAIRGSAADPLRYSDNIGGEPEALLREIKRIGLEGIVGKQRQSVYEPGRRSGAWIKLKCLNEQEFVIGGYTPPAGSRKYFGALLVGYYNDGKLCFAGKVGTGFNGKMLAALYKQFQKEWRNDCPFVDLPSKQAGKWVQGITPSEARKCVWINPVFVCQVRFAEWTRDGKLRQPVFLGLREDKKAKEVVREG
jgi:bifunctional non-homologous end joining protein LigD